MMALPAYRRVRRDDLISRWWPRHALTRMYLPEPVTPIRFWAALWLFIFGTIGSLSCSNRLCSRLGFASGRGGCRGRGRRGGRRGRWFRLRRPVVGRGLCRCSVGGLGRSRSCRGAGLGWSLGRRCGRGRSLGRCCGRGFRRDRGRLGSLLCLGRDGQGVGGDLVDRVLAVWRVVALGLVGRCHRDVHRLAFEQRRPFRYSVILDSIHEPGNEVPPDLRVGQLPTAKADGHLDPITIFEELDRAVDLRIEVAYADLRRQADFLEGDRALLALGLLLPLGQLVLVLTEVEELDHRRLRHRGDLDEVVSPFLRHLKGLRRGHDAQLSTLFVDHPDLWDPDHLIYAQVSTDGSPLVCCWSIRPAWGHTSPYRASRQDSTQVLNPTTDRPATRTGLAAQRFRWIAAIRGPFSTGYRPRRC